MKKVLILGASGSLANVVIPVLLEDLEMELTLFSRHVNQLENFENTRVKIIQGDVMNKNLLEHAMQGQDIVYANLAGNLVALANNVIKAMDQKNVKRLIWISSMGIYGETGEDHDHALQPYRQSAKLVEESNLDYTIIRPAWFTNSQEIDYKLTRKGESFQGKQISRRSIAALIYKLVSKPEYAIRESLGVAQV